MNFRMCVSAGMMAAACAAGSATADVIAYWRFPATVPASNVNHEITFPIAADAQANAGVCEITTDANVWNGLMPPANDVGQGAFQYFTGTTINAQGGDAAGAGLSMRGLTGLLTNGKSMTFRIDTTGFSDIVMAYAERVTATGPSTIDVSTSLDGMAFDAFTTLMPTRDATFRLRTIDLSSLAGLNNQPAVFIRLTVNGISNASGALRIDNVTFVPAPGAAGLMAVGVLALGRRRRA